MAEHLYAARRGRRPAGRTGSEPGPVAPRPTADARGQKPEDVIDVEFEEKK